MTETTTQAATTAPSNGASDGASDSHGASDAATDTATDTAKEVAPTSATFSFGETANSALGVNAQQSNLYGTGIGSFNDRMRDGVRGGGPFDDERVQGFGTGLFTAPSA